MLTEYSGTSPIETAPRVFAAASPEDGGLAATDDLEVRELALQLALGLGKRLGVGDELLHRQLKRVVLFVQRGGTHLRLVCDPLALVEAYRQLLALL
jgi:hypothetical protein